MLNSTHPNKNLIVDKEHSYYFLTIMTKYEFTNVCWKTVWMKWRKWKKKAYFNWNTWRGLCIGTLWCSKRSYNTPAQIQSCFFKCWSSFVQSWDEWGRGKKKKTTSPKQTPFSLPPPSNLLLQKVPFSVAEVTLTSADIPMHSKLQPEKHCKKMKYNGTQCKNVQVAR